MAGKVHCLCVTGMVKATGKDCFLLTNGTNIRSQCLVNCGVVKLVPFAGGLPQKKGLNPDHHLKIKAVKGASSVDQLSSLNLVINVPTVVPDRPVGARLLQFWEKWAALGISPRVVTVLKEGYTLPFRFRPNLTRSPNIISCYVNPQRHLYLLEALHQLVNKNAIEAVTNQTSLGFYNRLFLVPKPNNRWRRILDLSNLNKFLKTESFKVETPDRGVGDLSEFPRHILPHTGPEPIKEIYVFSHPGQNIPIQSTAIRPLHSSYGVHCSGQGGQISCITEGYKNPPVPRRLVGQSQIPPNLSSTYKDTNIPLSGTRLASEQRQIRTGTQTSFRFCRLPVRPEGGQGQTHLRTLADLTKIRDLMTGPVC